MVESPVSIVIELLQELIKNFIATFQIIYIKLIELFISLSIISGLSPAGFVVAMIFGSIVLFFILKFVFSSSKTFLIIYFFYFLLVLMVSLTIISNPPT